MRTPHNWQTGVRHILQRAAAYLLDMAILFLVLAPVGGLIQWAFIDVAPQTGPEIWRTLLWNFSVPAWLYFILSDSSAHGATVGKRLLRLKVIDADHQEISLPRALLRTAVKLLPWELVHLSAFALSVDMNELTSLQMAGLVGANLLVAAYGGMLVMTRGRRSVHDLAAQTQVVQA